MWRLVHVPMSLQARTPASDTHQLDIKKVWNDCLSLVLDTLEDLKGILNGSVDKIYC